MTLATQNFGTYVIQPVENNLFLGVGNSPGNENGACIILDANREVVLTEQGVHDIHNQDGELWVCGTDPVEQSDEWLFGNIYHRELNGSWEKIRTLPLTIHALGCWHDGINLWVSGGMHTGNNSTWKGRILKSVDGGVSWLSYDLNNYRVYDIIGFSSKMYAVGYDYDSGYTQDLHVSSDGVSWGKIAGIFPSIKPRLTIHDNHLVIVKSGNNGLYRIDSSGSATVHLVNFQILNQWNVVDSDGLRCYVLDSSGNVWRTIDFSSWEIYTKVPNSISIKWWENNGLIIGDMGLSAKIWVA